MNAQIIEIDHHNKHLFLELLRKKKRRREKKETSKTSKSSKEPQTKRTRQQQDSDIVPVTSSSTLALPSTSTELESRRHTNTFVENVARALTPRHVYNSKGELVQVNPCKRIYWDPKRNWIVIDNRNKLELFKEMTDPNLLAIKTRDEKTLKNAYVRQFENYNFKKVPPSILSSCKGMEFKSAFYHPDGYNPLRHNETYQVLYDAYDRRKKVKQDETKVLDAVLQQERANNVQLRAELKLLQHKLKKMEQKNMQMSNQLLQLQHHLAQPQPVTSTSSMSSAPSVLEPPPSRDPFPFSRAL